jgi:TRAP-type transport system periplasmic protein
MAVSTLARYAVVLCAVLGIAACGRQPGADARQATATPRFVLTYASLYPPTHPFSKADRTWMDAVAKASHDRIAFRPFWSGALLSSDMNLEELRHGLADIGLITPMYARGGSHLHLAQIGFYGGVKSMADQVSVYECLADRFPELDAELKGLHVLAVQGGNFPGLLTRSKPVHALSDLRGMRIRAPADEMEVLRALGADPVSMPMGEVYSALAKGVIDGVVASADTLKSQHFAEVARHFNTMRFSRGAYPARAMSERTWQRLPPDLQQILNKSRALWQTALIRELMEAEHAGLAYADSRKVVISSINGEDQQQLDQLHSKFALEKARELKAFGIDGVPVFREAQRLVAMDQPACPASGKSTARSGAKNER